MTKATKHDLANHRPAGRLEVICGCMFSGKTERLIAALVAAQRAGELVAALKHASDRPEAGLDLVSHSHWRYPARTVAHATEIPNLVGRAGLVGIDEGQFFKEDLVAVTLRLRAEGRRVIVAGLDRDCWGKPFSPMPELAAVADEVIATQAVCAACGQPATFTHRRIPVLSGQSMVGGAEAYEPRCLDCFQPARTIMRSIG